MRDWCRMLVSVFATISALNCVAGSQQSLQMKALAIVSDGQVLVQDVVENPSQYDLLGSVLSAPIASTPVSGASRIINRPQVLAAIAANHPALARTLQITGANSCRVERLAQTHQVSIIEKAARSFLDKQLGSQHRNLKIELDSNGRHLNLPVGEVSYKPWMRAQDQVSSRMTVWVDVLVDGETHSVVPIRFSANALQMVPVAIGPLAKGSAIDFDQIKMDYVDVAGVQGVPAPSLPSLLGKELIHHVAPGEVITLEAIRVEPMISAGDQVIAMATTGNITVKSEAIARADGTVNETIPLVNSRSGEQFVGRVVNKNLVEVAAHE
ncbi:MAG: flagellar basal body P-ring formation chaperone FlgA [Pseudomonadota bacterium]